MSHLKAAVAKVETLNKVDHALEEGHDDEVGGGEEGAPCIKVCVRVRPFIKEELEGGRSGGVCQLCIDMPTKTSCVMHGKGPEPKVYEFDRCYWSHSTDHPLFANQETLYQEQGIDMINKAMKGYNNCIFAYGQTGSGKSYSVVGGKSVDQQGLLPRVVTGLFERFDALDASIKKACKVSFLEVYNEQIHDLLADKGDPNEVDEDGNPVRKKDQKLDVRQHPTLGTFIPGLTECAVLSRDEVMDLVDYGMTLRAVSATAMNASSSRSHCMFSFKTCIEEKGKVARSQTHLVDLAGSERAGRTKATGDRLKEGAAINQSLSALARVIHELAKMGDPKCKNKKKIQVPWRQSKLTFILKDSLSGNSMTSMMAAISPNMPDYEETVSTMQFCQSVKMVQTAGKKNQVNEGSIEEMLKAEVAKLREQVEKLQKDKEACEDLLTKETSPDIQRKQTIARLEHRKSISEDAESLEELRTWYAEYLVAHPEEQPGEDDEHAVHDEHSDDEDDDDDDSEDDESEEEEQRVVSAPAKEKRMTVAKEEKILEKKADKAKEEFERIKAELEKAEREHAELEQKQLEAAARAQERRSQAEERRSRGESISQSIFQSQDGAQDAERRTEADLDLDDMKEELQASLETEEERQLREEEHNRKLEEMRQMREEGKRQYCDAVGKRREQLWDQMEKLIQKVQESEKDLRELDQPVGEAPDFFCEFVTDYAKGAFKQRASRRSMRERMSRKQSKKQNPNASSPEDVEDKAPKQAKLCPTKLDEGKMPIDVSHMTDMINEFIEDIDIVVEILEDLSDATARKTDLRVVIITDPEHPDDPGLYIQSRRYMPGELENLVEEEVLNYEDFSRRLEWLVETHKKERIVMQKEEIEKEREEEDDDEASVAPEYRKIGDAWALSAVGNTAEEEEATDVDTESQAPPNETVEKGVINVDASMAFSFDLADNHLQLAELAFQNLERRRMRQRNAHIAAHTHFNGSPGGSAKTTSRSPTVSADNFRFARPTSQVPSSPRSPTQGAQPRNGAPARIAQPMNLNQSRAHFQKQPKPKSPHRQNAPDSIETAVNSPNAMAFNMR